MNLKLFYPVKNPIDQANLFGQTSAFYNALGQKGHPGIDFEAPSGTKVYAPCDGDAFYTTDKDGGCGLWIRVPNNAAPAYNIILWHMYPAGTPGFPYAIPTGQSVVTPVKAGQLLGYSDNSGAPLESTGPHLHFGVMPCDNTSEALDPNNGYNGCVDPTPFFNGFFAEDIPAIEAILTQVVALAATIAQATDVTLEQKITWIQELETAIGALR